MTFGFSWPWKDSLLIDLHKVVVVPPRTLYHGEISLREITDGLGRSSQGEGPRGYHGAGGNNGTGADDRFFTDTSTVEDRGADPDQRSSADVAAVSRDPVPQYNVRVQDQWKVITPHVKDAAVLDITSGSNPY